MINYFDTVEEGQDKEVKEYVHVISKSETLSNPKPSVLVSSKVKKFKIFYMKGNSPQSKLALLRKQPRSPDRTCSPLSNLEEKI